MSHRKTASKSRAQQRPAKSRAGKVEARYTVGLTPKVAREVERYAQTADSSVSKAIASLVRLGLESQETRKREFFTKLKDNLDNNDPAQQDQLVDEFRILILGR